MLNNALANINSFVQLMRQVNNRLPETEVRFLQNTNLQFPKHEVSNIKLTSENQQLDIVTNFLGLLGATGALPVHYTEDVLHQLKAKNYAQKEFYDIFHQRIIELFYAADQVLAPIIDADAVNILQSEQSAIQQYLCDLLGVDYQLNTPALQHNSFYSNPTPSAAKLEQILQANTLLNIEVQQGIHKTEVIPEKYRNNIGHINSQNMRLNDNFVIGDRARFDHVYFSITILAENFVDFVRLKRDKKIIKTINLHARSYCANALKFTVNIYLQKQLIQPMNLNNEAYLGASSFL
jgi:type VI secretion system protein ImpH